MPRSTAPCRRTFLPSAALLAIALLPLGGQARELPRVEALAGAPAVLPPAAVIALRTTAPGVPLDTSTGFPTFVWGADVARAALLAPRVAAVAPGSDAETVARDWLTSLGALYRLTPGDVTALRAHDVQRLANGGTVVRFRNVIDGIEVFREEANVLVDRAGALVAVGGFVSGRPIALRRRAAMFTGSDAAAVALGDFGFSRGVAGALVATPREGGYTALALPPDARSAEGARLLSARTKPVWFRIAGDLVPAHYVEIVARDAGARRSDYYAYVVGDDGSVLYRRNQVAHAAYTYRVYAEPSTPNLPYPTPAGRAGFPHPTGQPDGFQPPFVAPNLITLQNAPFSRNDPWLPANATMTIGNNVEVYADLVAPELLGPVASNECSLAGPLDGDLHACVTSGTTFDHAFDFGQDPDASRAQVAAGITHLFYVVNWLHDWFYDAGFDEAAGNAQKDNYGRGGLGNDNIVAITQDYGDANNASMATLSDGFHPELNMTLWFNSAALARVSTPAAIAGVKATGYADFGAQRYDLTESVVAAQDAANGTGPATTDGCTAYTNAAAVAGRIALVDRGTCTFAVKARIAQDAGAAAVLIANNTSGTTNMTGDDPSITLPVLLLTKADGDALRAQLAAGVGVTMRLSADGVVRDGALDTMVVAHEWGHYISHRLISNANGLNYNQGGGLGEGWGDFHEMLLLVKESDRQVPSNANFEGTYSSNAFSLMGPSYPPDVLNNAFYHGDRRYPYTRDMSKNPLTLRHLTTGVTLPEAPTPSFAIASPDNAEVHNMGEVWTTMLWECYSNLLLDTGRLTFAQTQDRMKRYLVAAYKMTPVEPTFVTARDALLAVMEAQDPQDRALCLHGFAKRGLGVGAVAPPIRSEDNSGIVESYLTVLPAAGTRTTAIEYYHAGFDHYFVTSIADEITKLDNGTFAGWIRTGESVRVYTDAPAGSAPVCRFFSTAFGSKSSHFYTSDANECGLVKRNASWQFESPSVFQWLASGPTGDCPAGSEPLYRLYNNGQGAAPNHRYTTSTATRSAMIAKGWIPEGNGALGVIACSPL